ncbi:hypothetical protein KAM429_33180 [Aquipseudomonas alcaligenes]|uniref:Uncharacterized protein n=1 Tax=Aquipseudomonas alcaligenes TaxID=43263 RepID=A0AA37CI97_AQUAC|nr:hypothetical protein KAM428_30860 [Pseudomonas alcaligenes]GIZ72557.1 hypothetical protein KAM429_33180 [Pseudomonas alcaligenes]GIZ76908.1 hypothetical protein KAM430_33170 [Pseudomonas alcaligenes]GIZ80999.1 hypothetical protein KAM432_30470 [Pseudomonas alcaligenes]GIZ85527.1 hypothetical protein KAM434_32220 [Pseudomonas alcaligenes]
MARAAQYLTVQRSAVQRRIAVWAAVLQQQWPTIDHQQQKIKASDPEGGPIAILQIDQVLQSYEHD